MRREDLTTEELRLERLLQTLARDPAAPDPDFLKSLRETSTQAFLAAHTNRPQPRRVERATSPDPAVGRRLLRTMRIAMMSAVAMLLIMGSLPSSLFPSRGVELQVALDNLRRNDSVEIEVQNGTLNNYLVYWHDADQERVTFRWPSGNVQVIDGRNSVFYNTVHNSMHPAPELAELSLDVFKDKLLTSLNVNDPQVQSLVLSQRPKQVYMENGTQVYAYQFQAPAALNSGETLTVDARVDANTNFLLTMNSRVIDTLGNVQFEANAGVKGINRDVVAELNPLNAEVKAGSEIAMIEEVHGNAEVVDFAGLPNPEGLGSTRGGRRWNYSNGEGMNQLSVNRQMGFGNANATLMDNIAAGVPEPETAPPSKAAAVTEAFQIATDAKSGKTADDISGVPDLTAGKAGFSRSRSPAKDGVNSAGESTVAPPAARPDSMPAQVAQKMIKSAAPPAEQPGNAKSKASTNKASDPAPRAMASDLPAPSPPAPAPAPAVLPSEDKAAIKPVEKTLTSKSALAPSRRVGSAAEPASDSAAVPQQVEPSENQVLLKQQVAGMSRNLPRSNNYEAKKKSSTQRSEVSEEAIQANEAVSESPVIVQNGQLVPRLRLGAESWDRAPAKELGLQNAAAGNSAELTAKFGFGVNSRMAEVKSELRPGDLLKTAEDASNVVRAKLANDANLIVGPGSEVLLLKPTEVRLRFGELVLEVPPKDQVDLLGPEPEYSQEQMDNYKGNYRRYAVQKGSAIRRQVTGRGMFRIEKNQLQEMQEQPQWLVRYYASDSMKLDEGKAGAQQQSKQSQSNSEPQAASRASKGAPAKAPAAAPPTKK